jgi:hypothetical protein
MVVKPPEGPMFLTFTESKLVYSVIPLDQAQQKVMRDSSGETARLNSAVRSILQPAAGADAATFLDSFGWKVVSPSRSPLDRNYFEFEPVFPVDTCR